MINFRFHLVSLVAVFLALGLGILVGSTGVVDQKIVNRLDSEIDSVRKENAQRKDENKRLADENSTQQTFIDIVGPFAIDARLDNESVAIVAERGVSGTVVRQAETMLRSAGADVPAILWLEDSWQLDTPQRSQDLASALKVTISSTLRIRALDLLARRLDHAPVIAVRPTTQSTSTSGTVSSTTSSTTPKPRRVDALSALENAGFLTVSDGSRTEFDSFPAHAAHVLVVTGDDSHFLGTDMTAAFAHGLINAGIPTVVAAVYNGGSNSATAPERGAALASVLDDSVLAKSVSTLDDLELVQGRIAAVLALAAAGSGNSGHYGYGSGATAPLPPHPS